jgi:hypothetical protein
MAGPMYNETITHARGKTMAELWDVVWGKPQVDPDALAGAVEREALREGPIDYRTRLMIRDSITALERYWGSDRLESWVRGSPARQSLERIRQEPFGEVGFPLLEKALVKATDPETVRAFLRDLGAHLHKPTQLAIGGSIALILPGYLQRATQDIDVVNEVPRELREQHALLEELARSYQLQLAHFQSHYLPGGWEARLHSLEPFGKLQAFLVDVVDVFLSKLFSARRKDFDDLRLLLPALDRATIVRRLHDHCAALLAEPTLRGQAEQNWYILTGEALP